MATDQDFSFPTINDPFSHSIDSPPLWNLSPATSPNPYEAFITQKQNEDGKRKSLSCIENCRRRREEEEEEDDDDDGWKEKMDLLWEDFNEELCSTTTDTTSSSRREDRIELRTLAKRRSYNNNGAALLLPSRNGNIKNSSNKPGMVVLVKVLKKLFSVSNSQKKPRKRVLIP